MYRAQSGELINYFDHTKVMVPVDKSKVQTNGTVQSKDSVVDALRFEISKSYLFKNDAAILNIIAANQWNRPIYFTQPLQIGFDDYLRQDGLTYRLVPVANARQRANTDWMLDKILNKFRYGGATAKGIYYDEENRRHLVSIRNAHTILAMNLNAENRKEEAKKVLQHCDTKLPNTGLPYGMASRYGNDHNEKSYYFGVTAIEAGDVALGKKVLNDVRKDCQQQIAYYASLSDNQIGAVQEYEYQVAQQLLQRIDEDLKGK
jgi:hypothetical protein